MTGARRRPPLDLDEASEPSPGYNARARLAALEAEVTRLRELARLQDRLLSRAAQRLEALEHGRCAPEPRPPRTEPLWVPLAEASCLRGLSRKTIWRLVERGEVQGTAAPTGATRRRRLVRLDSLDAFLGIPGHHQGPDRRRAPRPRRNSSS